MKELKTISEYEILRMARQRLDELWDKQMDLVIEYARKNDEEMLRQAQEKANRINKQIFEITSAMNELMTLIRRL